MKSARSNCGNTLVLVVITIFALLVVAYLAINFAQLVGTHKEAQTAIDAASLAAAKDMSHIVIDDKDGCHFGIVGLVDDLPRKKDNRPVIGINTLMATVRLDAIIANKLGSSTMLVLAADDLQRAQADCLTLRKKIVRAFNDMTFSDKDGNTISIIDDANRTYDENQVKLGGGKRKGNILLSAGWYQSPQGTTNIPVPAPQNIGQVGASTSVASGSTTVYRPMVDVPVLFSANGSQGTFHFQFLPIGNEISLVSGQACEFPDPSGVDNWPGYLPPYLVRAEVDQEVIAAANLQKEEKDKLETRRPTSTLHNAAVAACGGPIRAFNTGTLQLAMPGGPPPKGQGPDCTSVRTIMNSTQIKLTAVPPEINSQNKTLVPATQLGTASSYTPTWNKQSLGAWLIAKGGAVPANSKATLEPSSYRTRGTDDPSVVLAYCVYDWLHSLYLRPNAEAVVNGLSADLNLYAGSTQTSSAIFEQGNPFIPAAYANVTPKYPVTFGLFNVPTDGVNDPRDLRNFDKDPDAYRRQFANVFGYVAADMTLPDASLVVAMNERGGVVTTNGNPAESLFDFWNAIAEMNQYGAQTIKAGKEVFDLKYGEVKAEEEKLKKMSETMQKDRQAAASMAEEFCKLEEKRTQDMFVLGRAMAAMLNGSSGVNVSLGMMNDRKALTALGVTKANSLSYELAGGNFYPPGRAATKEEIMGKEPVNTGQDAACPVRDWCAPPVKEGEAPILFFVSSRKAAIGSGPSRDTFLQPALAAGTVPQQNLNIIVFSVKGDATSGGTSGSISKDNPKMTIYGNNVLEGQLAYQNTASLVTKSPGSSLQEVWNCIARDNAYNYSASTGYFANPSAEGSNSIPATQGYPALAAEWTLRCPAPIGPPTTSCVTKPFVNLHSYAAFDSPGSNKNSDLSKVSVSTDPSGNVSYSFNGAEMHFYTGNDWMDKVLYTNSFAPPGTTSAANNDPAMKGGLYRGMAARDATGFGTAVTSGVQIVSNYTQAQWEKWRSDHLLLTNTNQYASYNFKDQTKAGDYLYSVYSQIVFYTLDQNSCPQLYRWSS
jgi:hypothetical protein